MIRGGKGAEGVAGRRAAAVALRPWWVVLALLLAAPAIVAAAGYLRFSGLQSVLGLPPLPHGFDDQLRAGSSMLVASLVSLPATLSTALLERPDWWAFRGVPGVTIYALVLTWCARSSKLRAHVEEHLGAKVATWLGTIVGLWLLGLSLGLLASAQAALHVSDLLIPGGATGPQMADDLAVWVRLGRDDILAARYLGLCLSWLALAHLVLLYLRLQRLRPATDGSGGLGSGLGGTAAVLLLLALLCLPTSFALVQVASGFPVVEVVTAPRGDAPEIFDGLLLERGPQWISVYEPDPPRLRLLTAAAILELRPGPRRSPFVLPTGEGPP